MLYRTKYYNALKSNRELIYVDFLVSSKKKVVLNFSILKEEVVSLKSGWETCGVEY